MEYPPIKDSHYLENFREFIENNPSIEDDYFKKVKNVYRYAIDMTTRECYQAVEGMYHNLNTLQSRSGNQLP